jgi:hypothetical protein
MSLGGVVHAAWTFLLARPLGLALGAAICFGLTLLLMPGMPPNPPPARGFVVSTMVVAVVMLFLPRTRAVSIGFFGVMMLATFPERGVFTRVWWEPVEFYLLQLTTPLRMARRHAQEKRAWLAAWRDHQLNIETAIFRARQFEEMCVGPRLADGSDGRVPGAMELTEPDSCRDFRRDARDIDAKWPLRFHREADKGWRWTLSAANLPSRWGGPGFLITLRPEPLLNRAGPILELDSRDLLRIRDSASAPSRVARTPIPAMKRVRACLLAAGASLQEVDVGWRYLPQRSEVRRSCPDLRIRVSGTAAEDGGSLLEVSFKEPAGTPQPWSLPIAMSYTLLSPGRFEITAMAHYRHYLLSADDTLHVTTENRRAATGDALPLPCEIDPSLNCD